MKKIIITILVLAICSSYGCTDNKQNNKDFISVSAMIDSVSDNGNIVSLITADNVNFERIYLNDVSDNVLNFVPSFGQFVRVEILPDYRETDPKVIEANATKITLIEPIIDAQYIRANGEYNNNKTVTIKSKEELENYYNTNKESYSFDFQHDKFITFKNAIEKYTNEYFENNFLVLAILTEGSGSHRHIVTGVNGNEINIKRISVGLGTDDMASWHIIVELNKEKYQMTNYDVKVQ